MRLIWRALPFIIFAAAFAVRVYAPDTGWVYKDQTYLRGQGIIALDDILKGDWRDLPLFTYNSSSGLFNPGLMIYIWAALAELNRSQLFAAMINLMVNSLTVVMVYSLVKTFTNRNIGLFAMALAGFSPWAISMARGTWQPAQLEFCFALTGWLLLVGLVKERPRWIIGACIAAAIAMWTYTLDFALMAQVGLATLIFFRRKLARPIFTGWIILALSFGLMFALAVATGRLSTLSEFAHWVATPDVTSGQAIVQDNPVALTLRIGAWLDGVLAWVNPDMKLWGIGYAFNQFWTALNIGLMALGAAITLRDVLRRRPGARLWVTAWVWVLLPALTFWLLKTLTKGLVIQTYYLLLTVPAVYLIAPLTLNAIQTKLPRARLQRAFQLVVAACVLAVVIFAGWDFRAAAISAYEQDYVGTLVYMPLRDTEEIGQIWRKAGCDVLYATRFENDTPWVASLWQESDDIRDEKAHDFSAETSVWQITPNKLNCMIHEDRYTLPGVYVQPVTFPDGSIVQLYMAKPATQPAIDVKMSTNIGWELLDLRAPAQVRAGGLVTVTHVWRIDSLPAEPFWFWYYQPNVKLVSSDGKVVSEAWGKSVEGHEWRVGDEIRSTLTFAVPPDVAPGEYSFRITLFDPNQKKNAAYFSSNNPAKPIVAIDRRVSVMR